jgi:hypothetical protein
MIRIILLEAEFSKKISDVLEERPAWATLPSRVDGKWLRWFKIVVIYQFTL